MPQARPGRRSCALPSNARQAHGPARGSGGPSHQRRDGGQQDREPRWPRRDDRQAPAQGRSRTRRALARRVQESDGLAVLALRDLYQRELQDDLRLVRIERQRIADRPFRPNGSARRRNKHCRASARNAASSGLLATARSAKSIAIGTLFALSAASARVASAALQVCLADCDADATLVRALGAAQPAIIEARTTSETAERGAERLVHGNYPLRFAFSASPSSSGMRSSNWSSASVTSCCAERPSTAQASRSLR